MLNPEAAQEQLKSFAAPQPEDIAMARAALLSDPVRDVVRGLLGRSAHGNAKISWSAQAKARETAIRILHGMTAEERASVFSVLFPGIAPHVSAAWDLYRRLPYQAGWNRKAFRAPSDPDACRDARLQWLSMLMQVGLPYAHQDIAWFAAWAPYLAGYYGDAFGILFAAAIDAGGADGDTVFQILQASASGSHETGAMGRHVTRGLLVASRPDGWAFIERLLLVAQRQEGLRQAILECVDEAHPEAYRRMLACIREHDLLRFSATLRAVDVWFGFAYDTLSVRAAAETLQLAERFLCEPAAARHALCEGSAADAYLALWSFAIHDTAMALVPASELLESSDPARRFAAVTFLSQTDLAVAHHLLRPVLDDPDLRVAMTAFTAISGSLREPVEGDFERVERLLGRMPEKAGEVEPLVWTWANVSMDRSRVADTLPLCLGTAPASRLKPYLTVMSPSGRVESVERLSKDTSGDPDVRRSLLALIGDSASYVREKAMTAIRKARLSDGEAAQLERLLTRKAGDLRRGVVSLLLTQADGAALDSARRLLESRDAAPRLAGLEVIGQMVKADRASGPCRAVAAGYVERRGKVTDAEECLLETLLDTERTEATLADGLGLFDPAYCSPRKAPVAAKPVKPLITAASRACLLSLDALIEANREAPVRLYEQAEEQLLGNITYGFPGAHLRYAGDTAPSLPLAELWETWWSERPEALRDADGLELLRAQAAFFGERPRYGGQRPAWIKDAQALLFGENMTDGLKHAGLVAALIGWFQVLHHEPGAPDFLLNAVEATFALAPEDSGWRSEYGFLAWLTMARQHRAMYPDDWSEGHRERLWDLLHWLDQPKPAARRERPQLQELLDAHQIGAATTADIYDQLIGARESQRYTIPGSGGEYAVPARFDELQLLTGRREHALITAHPVLREIIDDVKNRIVEVELSRGELPTAASGAAMAIRCLRGAETAIRLLRSLGSQGFARGHVYGWYGGETLSKSAVFSRLLRITVPAETDTAEAFAALVKGAKIPDKRLVELAMYAPQWARFVEDALGWPLLNEAVWWMHAHTKDAQWSVDAEIREIWTAQVAERTSLSAQELIDGAVDVAWFRRIHDALGHERWTMIDTAAKYTSGGNGHRRAQIFAAAMLGHVEYADLERRIQDKRHPDSVRALGLLPITGDDSAAEVLKRYTLVQEFLRGSRQFGAMRQASEKVASTIALENLARTAGYPDPIRLQWAMERQAVADLAIGPVHASAGDVVVTLSIDTWGDPQIGIAKNGKPLKAVPPAAKKDEAIAALIARKTEIKRQGSRMRRSLEEAMCRGDIFQGKEVRDLMEHPVLAPMLRSLVFINGERAGYPVDGGASLESHDGSLSNVHNGDALRIAHPHDLLTGGEWHAWQRDCFLRERIQPFKQIFRELYLLTESEQVNGRATRRYDGHQIQRNQSLALLGKRGWVSNPEDGATRKTFHTEGITVSLGFDYGYTTPAEVEGLTIDTVEFTRRGEWRPMPLSEVPPRVFSESMRDMDLVVSVAHCGGVDPETSASTTEMRAALVREACSLLKIDNVRFQGTHALIDGQLGTYSVHLGSAGVHRQPGGHLCIVPVHSQHRGRVFLPFMDDDPKSAEVISKTIMLARDQDIKDPTILEQIFAGARR